MPGADPFELLENSAQVQNDLGLTQGQLKNLHLAAVHNQDNLQELSSRLKGESPDQARAEIEDRRHSVQLMIDRELTPQQRIRFRQIMFQLVGPCMAVSDREISNQLRLRPDQFRFLAAACERKSQDMARAFRPPENGRDFCAVAADNRERIGQLRARADQDIVAMLEPSQRAALTELMGPKIDLEPPMPPNCRR